MIKKLAVNMPTVPAYSYQIFVNSGLLLRPTLWLPKNLDINWLVIITDHKVKAQYGSRLANLLKKSGNKVLLLSFPPGEKSKNDITKQYLEKQMLHHHCGRDTIILALGGGVVGDLAGFVAATYMRGIPYIQIPTTLLAMVDSSIGGKTGINTAQGKNLIGAFWQPKAVIADIHCLKTLSKKQMINGFIEAFKMFLTCDVECFQYVQTKLDKFLLGDMVILKNIIFRAIKIKSDIVNLDEKENNYRMILNFGHTIGHALEQLSNYKMLHGYAVAYGILVEAKISQLLGLIDSQYYQSIQSTLASLGILGAHLNKFDIHDIIKMTKVDKKARIGEARYVLLKNICQVYQNNGVFSQPVSDETVKRALLDVIRI